MLDILQFPIPMNSGGKGLEGSLVSIIIGYHTCIVVVYFYSNTLYNQAYIDNRYYLYYIYTIVYINIHSLPVDAEEVECVVSEEGGLAGANNDHVEERPPVQSLQLVISM